MNSGLQLSELRFLLAEQADRNEKADLIYEPQPPKIDSSDRKQ